ncbi:hypothetical protein ElyMa_003173700 [Elysia marginata]|uniref:MANSC domain-containing protein n=1 Tax=Elysia marginata TaxID=1093978 RepID=A0AAV4IYY3_9GAST|nr:hypothetical protein ElyMa_003173700 [Elysia marginata]
MQDTADIRSDQAGGYRNTCALQRLVATNDVEALFQNKDKLKMLQCYVRTNALSTDCHRDISSNQCVCYQFCKCDNAKTTRAETWVKLNFNPGHVCATKERRTIIINTWT